MRYLEGYKLFESNDDIGDIWYILCDIIESGDFMFDISQTQPGNVIHLNPESDYNFLFDPSKSADNGRPFHKAYHGTSPEFFSYHFKRKINTKQGFIINVEPKSRKLFNVRRISNDLIQFKNIVEERGYQCKFYKDIKSIGTGFNNRKDINIEVDNPWVYRLAIVIKSNI